MLKKFVLEGADMLESPESWLRDLFEFEFCAECGGDAEDHEVCAVPGMGTYFAKCLKPPLDHDERGPET
jgi:hypothetical protein